MNGLNAEQFDRIEMAFHAALEYPSSRWHDIVRRQLADSPRLIAPALRLLEAHAHGRGLQQAACSLDILDEHQAPGHAAAPGLPAGTCIGRWRIERLLARGGMSSVYLAQRDTPELSQRAALKLIAADADVARFSVECRILASLEHPGIARLIDGGVDDDGRPWLASEYVEGSDLRTWCDEHALDVRRRIALLIEVAEATAYAHAHLVVHRDIKPGNILVTADGHAKLVDFGIAKLLRDGDVAAATRTGARLMTPQYAAPEQVLGAAIAVQTDVHALGVLACELLTGCNPFAEPGDSILKTTRAIAEADPPLPSSLCTDPLRARQLRGDVDAILLKALRKKPADRYRGAGEFGQDLQNHLDGKSVLARRGSRAYRVRSSIRRHRWAYATILTSLLLIMGGFSWRISQVTAERDRANAVAEFFDGLITGLDPGVRSSEDASRVTITEVLDIGRARLLQSSLTDSLRAQLLTDIAEGYQGVVEWSKAADTARDALALDPHQHWPAVQLYDTRLVLGIALFGQKEYAEAERIFQDLANISGTTPRQRARRDTAYGNVLINTGRLHEAAAALRQAVTELQETDDALARINALDLLATTQSRLGENDLALATSLAALELTRQHFPDNELLLASAEANHGVRLRRSDPQQAVPFSEQALHRLRRVVGDHHPDTINAESNHALLLMELQRYDEAEELMRRVIEQQTQGVGAESREAGQAWQNLAAILFYSGQYDQAIDAGGKALAILDSALPANHYMRAFPMLTMAGAQLASNQAEAARDTLRTASVVLDPALPADSLPRRIVRARDAMAIAGLGGCEQAVPLLEQAWGELSETERPRYAAEFQRAFTHCPPAPRP